MVRDTRTDSGLLHELLDRTTTMMQMSNPWLDITEVDYVGHMTSPAVNQRPVLSRLLGDALESALPGAVLVLGCSTATDWSTSIQP
jgi:hypothetical protein